MISTDCRKCAKSDFCYVDDVKPCVGYEPKKLTNADRIRSMTDEELANFIGFATQDAFCYGRGMRSKMLIYPQFGEYETTINWLKEEASDDCN